MKKILAIIAIVTFVGATSTPLLAVNNAETIITMKVKDEKPKLDKAQATAKTDEKKTSATACEQKSCTTKSDCKSSGTCCDKSKDKKK